MSQEYKRRHQSFPLRPCPSILQQANDLAHNEGISLNHFISLAIAEKISRMEKLA
jgi:predicted HicB family RNase H-like nuclease